MAKGNLMLKIVLIAVLLLLAIVVIGAGCQKEITGKTTKPEEQQSQQQQQLRILFSDDFSSYSTGATPNKWQVVIKDSLTATTKGMTQASGQYGMVLELKGKMLATDSSDWKDYTITTNFKISAAANHIGPEIAFRIQDNDNYYLLSTKTSPSGTNYFLYKITSENIHELKRRASSKRIDDDSWHKLQLSVQGNDYTITVDDSIVLEGTTDGSFTQGAIAIMTDPLSVIYFDDFVVIGSTI
ncbi:MAG: LamG domain-containing protein [Candidatus Pacearchaeota archaeon]|nr:LamG domain-containing protein [Candidatus Pacearchaeota archaeon]